MGFWKKAVGALTGGTLSPEGILKEVDNLATSAEEKATIRKSIIETMVQSQSAVIMAEAQSESWLARSWRPILMLMWGGAVTYNFFLGPLLETQTVSDFPEQLWDLLILGVGGYVGGRTVEKLTKTAMPLMTARQELKKLKILGKQDQ